MTDDSFRSHSQANACRGVGGATVAVGRPSKQEEARARCGLLGSFLGLGMLAWFLPGPVIVADTLLGQRNVLPAGSAAPAVAETALLLVSAVVVWTLLAWALVVAGISGMSRLPGPSGYRARRILGRLAPIAVRRVLLTVVGASMVTGIAACGNSPVPVPVSTARGEVPATVVGVHVSAAPGGGRDGVAAGSRRSEGHHPAGDLTRTSALVVRAGSWIVVEGSAIHLLATPDRESVAPVEPTPPDPISIDWPSAGTATGGSVVVLRGDSLWSIAARHLPASASPSEIDRAWHRWYSANSAVIGTNPNLILPGQILQAPHPEMGDRP